MWPDGIVPDNKLFKRRKFPSELFVGAKPSLNFSVCLRMFDSRQDVSNLFLFAESFKRMFRISLKISGICVKLRTVIGNHFSDRGDVLVSFVCFLKQLNGELGSSTGKFSSREDHPACIIQNNTYLLAVVLTFVPVHVCVLRINSPRVRNESMQGDGILFSAQIRSYFPQGEHGESFVLQW